MRKFKLFLFVSVISSVWLYGQSPGGVSTDLSVWYKADAGITTNGSKQVTQWISSSSTSVTLTPSGTAYIPYNDQTTYTNMWNFNPTLSYDGTNNYLRNTTTAYLNPAGSVHYIAVARLSRMTNAYRNLFAIAGNDDGFFLTVNSNTVYPMPTIGNNFNYPAAGPSSTNTFGIYSAILPKTTSQGSQRGFNSGTRKIYTSPYPITGGAYVLPTTGIGAYLGADGTTGDNFQGDIAEVILYHSISGGDLTDADLQKIHSYLAIKYGITLDPSQNYVSSSASTVWNATANATYYNNVFGIARDDQGTLYQKQSKSVNPSQKLIIGAGNSLSNTNSANTNTLTDGQFLVVGDNGLKQSLSIPLSYPTAPGGETNNRFASVWKVQNTGNTGTVTIAWPKGTSNLHLVRSTNESFDAADQFIPMTLETTVNGVVYNMATVTFNNGEFFTFAGYAHAPGGVVNNLGYWYRADKNAVNTGEGTDVTSWTDFFSGAVSSKMYENTFPKYVKGAANYFNYNPGINFTAVKQSLGNDQIASTVTSTDYDIFTFTKEGWAPLNNANNRIFSALANINFQRGDIAYWDGIGVNKRFAGNTADEVESVTVNITDRYLAVPGGINFAATIPSIMYNRFGNTTVSRGLNGGANGANGVFSPRGILTGGHVFGSTIFNSNGSDNDNASGHIGEAIIYGSGNLTETERRRVDSYLAIKYGLTLGRTATNHYLSSAETVVWNGAQNTSYNSNIFGLGRDDISALHQKVSVSVNSAAILTIATSNDFVTDNLDASRTVISDDQEFFIAGDNNDTDLPMVNVTLGSNTGKIIQRKWLSQRTGTLENTYFQADLSAYESQFNIQGTTVYMVIGDDDTFTTNRLLIPGTKVGGKWIFNHNFDSENTKRYFTFGVLTTEVCYKPGAIITAGNPALISKVGISSLTRAGIQNSDNWPAVRNGAWLVLEARTKGFVVNRMPFNTSGNPEGIPASDFVEGMLVYDTTNKCLKMYTSQNGGSFAWFCISTQTCPD